MKHKIFLSFALFFAVFFGCSGPGDEVNYDKDYNEKPVANAGPAQNVVTGSNVKLDGSASSDADQNALTYSWTIESQPSESAAALSNAGTVNPFFTADAEGEYVISLVVNDGIVDSDSSLVTVTAYTNNVPPVADAGRGQEVKSGSNVLLNGSASSDANRDLITYSWSIDSKPAGSSAALSDALIVNPFFSADAEGEYIISLVVNDGVADSDPCLVVVNAYSSNVPPMANAGLDIQKKINTLCYLDGSLSRDADKQQITYNWIMNSKPSESTAVLTNNTAVNPSFTPDKTGSYVISLIVNDGTDSSAADTVIITAVTDNAAPVADAGTIQNVLTGSVIHLDGSDSSDENGDTITYSWHFNSVPSGSTAVLSSANTSNPYFTADIDGSYVAALVVSDGTIQSECDTTYVYASTGNLAPVAEAGNDIYITINVTVDLNGGLSVDGNGDTVTYTWYIVSVPTGSTVTNLTNSTSVTPSFIPDVEGAYVINLVVNDGTEEGITDTVVVYAGNPPSWVGGYPRIQDITDTSAVLKAAINEGGYVYWVCSIEKIDNVTAEAVRSTCRDSASFSGNHSSGINYQAAPNSIRSIDITGLDAETEYYVYVTAEDDAEPRNLQESVVRLRISHSELIVYQEDFEAGWGMWSPSNGVWEIGIPTSGPNAAHAGTNLMATVLAGDYPNTSSRMVSPTITLPEINTGDEILLRYWHWFNIAGWDAMYIQVSVQNTNGTWGDWISLKGYSGYCAGVWTYPSADLSSYAGNKIKLGFLLNNGNSGCCGYNDYSSTGWYVDDIIIYVSQTSIILNHDDVYTENFEEGLGDWHADNGTWEVGTPTSGPNAAYSGSNLMATVLAGNYVNNSTRMTSPAFQLPDIEAGEEIELRYWHWFNIAGYDAMYLQVTEETSPGTWSAWINLQGYSGYCGGVWTIPKVDLSAYSGKKIKLGFLLNNGNSGCCGYNDYSSTGWYVDDISIAVKEIMFINEGDIYVDSLDNGISDWWVSNGTWQIGEPTSGPGDAHDGIGVAATVLDGNYTTNSSYLVSPSYQLPVIPVGESIYARIWHWFNIASYDTVYVQISEQTTPGVWGNWSTLATYSGNCGGVWTYPLYDISVYSGKKIRLGFYLGNGNSGCCGYNDYSSTGWYIDEVTIITP